MNFDSVYAVTPAIRAYALDFEEMPSKAMVVANRLPDPLHKHFQGPSSMAEAHRTPFAWGHVEQVVFFDEEHGASWGWSS